MKRRRLLESHEAVLIISSTAALVAGLLMVIAYLNITGSSEVETRIGDDVFEVGNAEARSKSIKEDGPLLFQDLLSHGRGINIFVQHLGDDPSKGWYAFSSRPPRAPASCQLRWIDSRKHFVDRCSKRTFPANGKGLEQFEARVVDGNLQVNLRKQT